jgi:hypothetical protein
MLRSAGEEIEHGGEGAPSPDVPSLQQALRWYRPELGQGTVQYEVQSAEEIGQARA